jgi:hypothetical protein
MDYRYDKNGIAYDYSGLSALFDGSDFEEAAHKLVRDIESKHIVETKELWDAKGNRAKGKSLEARETNLALDNIKAQIIKHYQRISDREAFVTAEMVRNAYQGIGGEYETLLKAFDRENEVFKKRVGKDRKLATYQSRVVARNYVAAFIKSFYKRSDMSMLELTPDFIKEFASSIRKSTGGSSRPRKQASKW